MLLSIHPCEYKGCDELVDEGIKYCIFHDENFLKGENYDKNKDKIATRFQKKLSEYAHNFNGYFLPDLSFNHYVSRSAQLLSSGATFYGLVDFSNATFTNGANFSNATFTKEGFLGGSYFGSATFLGGANFSYATFTESANFIGAEFKAGADFERYF